MVKRELYETPDIIIQILCEDVICTSPPSLEKGEDPDWGEDYT